MHISYLGYVEHVCPVSTWGTGGVGELTVIKNLQVHSSHSECTLKSARLCWSLPTVAATPSQHEVHTGTIKTCVCACYWPTLLYRIKGKHHIHPMESLRKELKRQTKAWELTLYINSCMFAVKAEKTRKPGNVRCLLGSQFPYVHDQPLAVVFVVDRLHLHHCGLDPGLILYNQTQHDSQIKQTGDNSSLTKQKGTLLLLSNAPSPIVHAPYLPPRLSRWGRSFLPGRLFSTFNSNSLWRSTGSQETASVRLRMAP